jgi:site-specific DNA recombinase
VSRCTGAIKNPGYCGKILIPKLGPEEAHMVTGIHEPLISETLFHQIQEVLTGRKRNEYIKLAAPDDLPLRGFMKCCECGRTLTGSSSKGRSRYYFYYHCNKPCRVRYKCEEVNEYFLSHLHQYVPRPGMAKLFREVVCDTYNDTTSIFEEDPKKYIKQVTDQNNRITKARELLLADAITAEEYREIKTEAENTILKLEARIADLGNILTFDYNIFSLVDASLENLKNLTGLYENADIEAKQYIIGSIFPEKFVFDGEISRTARMNLGFQLIYHINNRLERKKMELALNLELTPTKCTRRESNP